MIYAHKDQQTAGLRESGAAHLVRLHNRRTGEYLHLTATRPTPDVGTSWLGTRTQAATLKERAHADGADWPYRVVQREI